VQSFLSQEEQEEYAQTPIEFFEKINKQFDLTPGENFFSDSLHTFALRALSSDSCARKDTSVHKLRTTLPDFEAEALDRALHTEERAIFRTFYRILSYHCLLENQVFAFFDIR
jgi:hypothetical protein